ncbi:MAG: hypothetical protein PHC52_14250 [Syntrophales bacterium]|nr:hypothetical protein [Syntrophales bacterium]
MSDTAVFKIRRAFLVPFILDAVLILVLFAITVGRGAFGFEAVVLSIMLVLMGVAAVEMLSRRITADDEFLRIRKMARKKELRWPDITHVGVVAIGKKIYLVLTTTRGFHIVSNAYENFQTLAREIVTRAGEDRVEEKAREISADPPARKADIIWAWIGAALLSGMIYIRTFLA